MRVIVTGAAGFIGSTLVERCLADGYDVLGADSFTDYYQRSTKQANLNNVISHPRFHLLEGPIEQTITAPLLKDVELVFHQAGQPGVRGSWETGFKKYVDNNIVATQALLESCRQSGVPRLIMASSSSVYGNAKTYPVTETDETRPFSPYGVTKLSAERLALAYAENFGLEVFALRYFTVYGPRQRPDMATHRLIASALGRGEFNLFGDGTHIRDFTYVDDVVQANMCAGFAPTVDGGGVLNICGGSSVSMLGLIDLIGELTGRELTYIRAANQAGDVKRTGGLNQLAKQTIGWSPKVGLGEGVSRQVDWMRALEP